jgi:hypothetical protein
MDQRIGLQTAVRRGLPVTEWPINNASNLLDVLGVPSLVDAVDRLIADYGITVVWHVTRSAADKRVVGIHMSRLARSGLNMYVRTRDLYFPCTAGDLPAAIAVLQEG